MDIRPTRKFIESYLQHRLDPSITVEQIGASLPGIEDQGEDADGRVTHYWSFLADGRDCAIWDYRGLRWSAFGPREVFNKLGLEVIGGVDDVGKAVAMAKEVGR